MTIEDNAAYTHVRTHHFPFPYADWGRHAATDVGGKFTYDLTITKIRGAVRSVFLFFFFCFLPWRFACDADLIGVKCKSP